MAKTLAQGRKPGSGRKPGKAKTLLEGRKPGSGRKKRQVGEVSGGRAKDDKGMLGTRASMKRPGAGDDSRGVEGNVNGAEVAKGPGMGGVRLHELDVLDAFDKLRKSPPPAEKSPIQDGLCAVPYIVKPNLPWLVEGQTLQRPLLSPASSSTPVSVSDINLRGGNGERVIPASNRSQ
ncbi:HDL465Cp [Eremothecium sinecaudum]|uniref:HDL465Cp n=1 Tax=Eremothecium sinecaudum TaxID=45286 RepID=A0A0X8HRT0_9SACH|nr:HDL465Cp [Eremothecium sinecaudum]AMD20279.1 HDL465Cp [Eremothecium sinecaudum]